MTNIGVGPSSLRVIDSDKDGVRPSSLRVKDSDEDWCWSES